MTAAGAPGKLIGSGRNADVYDLGNGQVLRRYRDGRPERRVAGEAEVMAHARAHGVPVPEVFEVSGADIVMARAAGPTMVDALARRPWTVRAQAGLLARLHAAVHRVPPLDWLRAPFGDPAGDAAGGGAREGAARDEVLLHHDLHPMNVILTPDGPQVVDWEGAARGPAVADVAMTWVITAFSEISGSRVEAAATRVIQALFARAFLRAAGPVQPRWLEIAVRHRLGDRNLLPSEAARLERLLSDGRFPGGR